MTYIIMNANHKIDEHDNAGDREYDLKINEFYNMPDHLVNPLIQAQIARNPSDKELWAYIDAQQKIKEASNLDAYAITMKAAARAEIQDILNTADCNKVIDITDKIKKSKNNMLAINTGMSCQLIEYE